MPRHLRRGPGSRARSRTGRSSCPCGPSSGRAEYGQLARGQITDEPDGFLELIADPTGEALLGVGIVGEGATELVHMGQLVLIGSGRVRELVDDIFNFPTMAEAYRVAALDVLAQVAARHAQKAGIAA